MTSATPPTLPPLRDVIRAHGLDALKSLGQNFLLDPRLLARIAAAAGDVAGMDVVEIGPGPGGLTRALLAAGAKRVVAIERDNRCVAALAELAAAYPGRLEIVAGDALALDVTKLSDAPRRIVANLPYNIATPLLIGWLKSIGGFASLTLMFQREVAERLVARPGDNAYGRLGILTQWLTRAEILFDISPGAFLPPPKVTSSLVRLLPRSEPLAPAAIEDLEKVTAAAFGQRRKMLRSSLKSLGTNSDALLEAAGIAGTRRAEELDVPEFCALARGLAATRLARA